MDNVVTLHFRPCIADDLRSIADAIDDGRLSDVSNAVLVAEHKDGDASITGLGGVETVRMIGLLQIATAMAVSEALDA